MLRSERLIKNNMCLKHSALIKNGCDSSHASLIPFLLTSINLSMNMLERGSIKQIFSAISTQIILNRHVRDLMINDILMLDLYIAI